MTGAPHPPGNSVSASTPPPFDALRCPLCRQPLGRRATSLRCPAGHAFDIARQGYASLLTGSRAPAGADTQAMVAARDAFLAAGHYAPLARALAEEAAGAQVPPDGTVLDAGTGTGYYLAAVLDALPAAQGIGLDLSKYALRRAARAHPRLAAAVWDVWRPLPLPDARVDLLLNVFAPRNGPEFHRVLRPGGTLLVITPTARHLSGLPREHLGLLAIDPDKDRRLRRTLEGHFAPAGSRQLEYTAHLPAPDVAHLVGMGPSAHHLDSDATRAWLAERPGPVPVTISVTLSRHHPREGMTGTG